MLCLRKSNNSSNLKEDRKKLNSSSVKWPLARAIVFYKPGNSVYSFSLKFLFFSKTIPIFLLHSETIIPKNQQGETYSATLHAEKLIPQSKILWAEAEDV